MLSRLRKLCDETDRGRLILFLLLALVLVVNIIPHLRQNDQAEALQPGYYDNGRGDVFIQALTARGAFDLSEQWHYDHPDRFIRLMDRDLDIGPGGETVITITYYLVADDPPPRDRQKGGMTAPGTKSAFL